MPRIYKKDILVGDDAIDAHRHVNNQEFLRWMEEVAIEHSCAQGWPMQRYFDAGASWYVRSHTIEYLRPAMLRDEIAVYTWIAGLSERTSPRRTLFVRRGERPHILAQAETLWTFVNIATGRSIPISEEVRAAFEVVESEDEVFEAAGLR
jgi:acyl-CoA thioester hydrolase